MNEKPAMTPEERFTKIENFLVAVTEHSADHDERFRWIENLLATVAEHQTHHDERFRQIENWMIRHEEGFGELQNRLTLALTRVAEAQQRTEEAQRMTEEKLNALIDTVDRIIRRNGPDA